MTGVSSANAPVDVNLLERSRRLEAEGHVLEALDVLKTKAPRDGPTDALLLKLRHEAFTQLDRSRGREPWLPKVDDPFPDERSVPEIDAGDLDADVLGGAIVHHGVVLVHGLLASNDVDLLRCDIDRAFTARTVAKNGAATNETRRWFKRFMPGVGMKNTYAADNHVRTVDSPGTFNDLMALLEEHGVVGLIGDYFGERPTLSANKSELRRVDPEIGPPDFHQDGAFLGSGIRTVNLWLSLSHCGRDAPGLDFVPQRVGHILETGIDGAVLHWTVSPATVARDLGDPPIVRPEFAPGDALLFDHYLVHRTANDPEMPNERYAIETWFFAPSAYPLPTDGELEGRPHLPLVS